MSSGVTLPLRSMLAQGSIQRLYRLCCVASLMVLAPLVQAGQYNAEGYIVMTSMKDGGKECVLAVAGDEEGSGSQVGSWSCSSAVGKNLLDLAELGKKLRNPVRVTFSDSEHIPSPVLSVELLK